jgi:hypothetical protein
VACWTGLLTRKKITNGLPASVPGQGVVAMISFSSKPRQNRQRTPIRNPLSSDAVRRPEAPNAPGGRSSSSTEPDRDDELVDLEHLTEAFAFRGGWHDSSMDLRRGLDTAEVPLDTLPDELRDSLFGNLR